MHSLSIEEIWARWGSSLTQASKETGIPRSTLWSQAKKAGLLDPPLHSSEERLEIDESSDQKILDSHSFEIQTVDQLLESTDIDTGKWHVERVHTRRVERTRELASGKEVQHDLWQIKVWLRLIAPPKVIDAFENICKRLPAPSLPAKRYKPGPDPHLAEISMCDIHFGKYGWSREVGENYDLAIAESVYETAFDELLTRVQHFNLDRILLPVGNDFFHFDSIEKHKIPMTVNGTAQDVDGRWSKVYEYGVRAIIRAIELAVNTAPVHVTWVPGNHDYHVSWYMVRELAAYFRNNANVVFDLEDLKQRKYHSYGINLLGFTHGDEEKMSELPLIMASEEPMKWATSKWREIHLGHWHKKKEMTFVSADEFGPVRVRILPSLSGTDAWHYRKGYVGGPRAAEAYLYSRDNGYTGHFSSNV